MPSLVVDFLIPGGRGFHTSNAQELIIIQRENQSYMSLIILIQNKMLPGVKVTGLTNKSGLD